MLAAAELDQAMKAVEASGLLSNPRRLDAGASGSVITGEVDVLGEPVTLRIVFGPEFPRELPKVLLTPGSKLDIPHTLGGVVCYQDSEGIVLDRRRPDAIAVEAVERAVRVLIDGAGGRNHSDYADEWGPYWIRLGGPKYVSVFDPPERVEKVVILERTGSAAVAGFVARSRGDLLEFYNGREFSHQLTSHDALYIPLRSDAGLTPPTTPESFWTAREVSDLVWKNVVPGQRERLAKLAGKARQLFRIPGTYALVLSLPRPSGGATLFGVRFSGVFGDHPLFTGRARGVEPFALERWDRSYLVPRGGGVSDLSGKRVLLAGCGAVGGHLAFELARAGVLDLTLIDPQSLSPENTFRHVLGRESWGQPKVEALKEAIERQIPYARVTALVDDALEAIASGRIRLEDYRLIVSAMGAPTPELELNEQIQRNSRAPALLVTWLEPYGIGGHAMLTKNGAGGGCFECLYTPPDEGSTPLENRAAFAAAGQSFGRALTGCGSLHTPYGSADALRTAALAAELAVNALMRTETGNPIRSWKGEAVALHAAGYLASSRHSLPVEELHARRYDYRTARCLACGSESQNNA